MVCMEYVMGIDGGGTKTIAVISDINGIIAAQSIAGSTNPNVAATHELEAAFQNLFDSLEKQLPDGLRDITCAFAGISGAGNQENKRNLQKLLKRLLPEHITIQVEADTINALYSGTYGKHGMVQISGTGSITYGINRSGKHDRAGGWGYLFGDEGSGYDIGRQGMTAALQSYDGRGPDTILMQMMYDHFNIDHPQKLIREIYTSSAPKSEISPLSKLVFAAYKQKDPAAVKILSNTGKEIAHSIKTLYQKLFEPNEEASVVLCGGVFNEKEVIPRLVKNELSADPGIRLILPKVSPAAGSLIGAYLMKQITINDKIIHNLINTI